MLTANQIKWAASHDWFIQDNLDGTIMVRDASTLDGVYSEKAFLWVESFGELRAWAGY